MDHNKTTEPSARPEASPANRPDAETETKTETGTKTETKAETKTETRPGAADAADAGNPKKRQVSRPSLRWQRFKGLDGMRRRAFVLMTTIFFLVALIAGRLVWLMLIRNDEYQQKAASQQLKTETIPADRGTIYDCNSEALVESSPAWVVELKPHDIWPDQREEICQTLSSVLELDYSVVRNKVVSERYDTKFFVKLTREQKDTLMAYIYRDCYVGSYTYTDENGKKVTAKRGFMEDSPDRKRSFIKNYHYIRGVCLTLNTRRNYLRESTLASTVLGFTNFDNIGSSGLENYYNTTLKGIDGKTVKSTNSNGGQMPFDYSTAIPAQAGKSLQLTLDANIQATLEKYLRQAVIDNKVENRAVGIIMNVNTGAVLAMSVMGDYDLAHPNQIADPEEKKRIDAIEDEEKRSTALVEAQQKQWRNKAVSDAYEPGSVFKPITMAAALEEGVTRMDETFKCVGYKVVAGRTIHCHKAGGHGTETLTEGMMNSCNPVLMTLGERLGAANFCKYFSAFGLTTKTEIDLPGEDVGMSHALEKMGVSELASSSFGQTFTVTPIQMITAFAAVTNGGYLVQPYLVDKVLDANGNLVESHQPYVRRQVISETTSRNINSMLEATAGPGGTAHNVHITGYRIGGKTGTSEKISLLAASKGKEKKYVASFAAVAPVNNPEIAVLVMLDEPDSSRAHGGGSIVAPVVRGILSEVLPYLGVDTIYSDSEARLLDTAIPNVVGMTVEKAQEKLAEKGLTARVIGDGAAVTGQIPSSARSAPRSCTIVLTTESDGELPKTTVPSLVGLSPTEVARAVKDKHLNIRYAGTGYESSGGVAKSQDIPVGSRVEEGTVVTVEFTVEGITD